MIVSSLSRAAAVLRVLLLVCVGVLAVAVHAAGDVDVDARPQSHPRLRAVDFILPASATPTPTPAPAPAPPPSPPPPTTSLTTTPILPSTTSTTTSSIPPATTVFDASFTIPPNLVNNEPNSIPFVFPPDNTNAIDLILCQSNATEASELSTDNTWIVLTVAFNVSLPGVATFSSNGAYQLPVNFSSTQPNPTDFDNLFFCWGNVNFPQASDVTCNAFSPSFSVAVGPVPGPPAAKEIEERNARLLPRFSGTRTETLLVQSVSGVLSMSGAAPLAIPAAKTSIHTSVSIKTVVPTSTTDPTAALASASAATATSEANVAATSDSKLATGAIIGIGVGGAAVLLLLAFLAFALIRRRRRRSPAQGKHMLLKNTTTTSNDRSARSPPEKPFTPAPTKSFLQTRPPSGFDYPRLSLLSTGTAIVSPRNSTAPVASGAIAVIPENMSEISGPVSPRSTLRSVAIFSEPYEDMPAPYTDERPPHASSQTPFLSEPGMSAEELSRLEEEERRIDAAIAEAERHR